MRNIYRKILQTEAVESAQRAAYGLVGAVGAEGRELVGMGAAERAFIAERDSFYLASVSASGWPYVQHRGGVKGFLKVIGEGRLAFADLEGNRQLFSVGNLAGEDRVSLFLMDYRARERLKILGRARVVNAANELEVAMALGVEGTARMMVVEVAGFDWNCSKFITQRFTREEVAAVVGPLRERIEELETEVGKD